MSRESARKSYERNRAKILKKKREAYRQRNKRRDEPDGELAKLAHISLPLDRQQKPKPYLSHVLEMLM